MVEGISIAITSSEAEGEADLTCEPGSFSATDMFASGSRGELEQDIEKKSARKRLFMREREREAEKERANAYPAHRFQLDKKKGPGKTSEFGGGVVGCRGVYWCFGE